MKLLYLRKMNVNELISRFFGESRPIIEVFDEKNIYDVYKGLQEPLKCMPDIEISVLQGLAYCFYEVMDNAILYSGGHELLYEDVGVYIEPANNWQGVLVFFELISNREINPDDIVSGRTDVKEEYNETFLAEINDIDKLW